MYHDIRSIVRLPTILWDPRIDKYNFNYLKEKKILRSDTLETFIIMTSLRCLLNLCKF